MTKIVEVVLAITVEVDGEYSGAEHANDIILTTRKTFPAAKVKVLKIDIGWELNPPVGQT